MVLRALVCQCCKQVCMVLHLVLYKLDPNFIGMCIVYKIQCVSEVS